MVALCVSQSWNFGEGGLMVLNPWRNLGMMVSGKRAFTM